MKMKTVNDATYTISLYLSGPIEKAKDRLRQECLREGLCVTIEPTTFIYTGGEEAGYRVGLLNYPRFPCEPHELEARARLIAEQLLEVTFQHSALIVTPMVTYWMTLRRSD